MKVFHFLLIASFALGVASTVQAHRGMQSIVLKLLTTGSIACIVVAAALSRAKPGPFPRWVVFLSAAFLASMAGDAVLSSPDIPLYFPIGIGLYLIAHIFYLWTFITLQGRVQPVVAAVLFAAMAVYYAWALFGRLDNVMRVAVGLYMLVSIAVISFSAGLLFTDLRKSAAVLFFAGAVLIGFSDTLISVHNFVSRIKADQLLILGTYYLAQLSIGIAAVGLLQPGG